MIKKHINSYDFFNMMIHYTVFSGLGCRWMANPARYEAAWASAPHHCCGRGTPDRAREGGALGLRRSCIPLIAAPAAVGAAPAARQGHLKARHGLYACLGWNLGQADYVCKDDCLQIRIAGLSSSMFR